MSKLARGCAIAALGLGPAWAQTTAPAQPAASQASAPALQNVGSTNDQPSDAERRFRIMLLQRSMGFGGIFGPLIAPLNKPGTGPKSCGSYSDHAACQAYRNGDLWAADRLQQKRSTPAERDWYGH